MSSLKDLGWNPAWAAKMRPEESACIIGRAAFESRGIYHVLAGDGKTWMAELKGILRKGAGAREAFPIVGDWVLVEPQDSRRGLIVRVLPRESALIRREQSRNEATRRTSSTQMLAANVDWALITSSLNEEWNVRRLERYLGLVREAKIKPALLLTKTDLVKDRGKAIEAEARAIAPDLPILRFNALKGEGIAELKTLLGTQGTAVLLGSSGVGKSTLVNALLGRQEMATGEVREKDQRGRHTTVGRYLLPLPWGGCLIDSPGLRDLGLTDEHAVDEAFEDITALALTCRFSDCRHEDEPGCAVQAAITDGKLDGDRFDAYVKLKAETAEAKKRTQIGAVRYERDRGKVVGKAMKSFYKEKGKGAQNTMKSHTEYLVFNTEKRTQILNLTPQLEAIVAKSGIQEGLMLVNPMHITASVYVNDAEPGLYQDILAKLEELAPYGKPYKHHNTGEDNGDAHLKRQLLGQQVTLAITKGLLDFGPWEQVHYAEFDGQRPKRVLVKIIGE